MLANQEFFTPTCKLCGSAHVVKFGTRNNIQRWWCKECRHKFVANNAISGMRTPAEQVASAISMYYEGMSLNAIRRQFSLMHNYLPSDSTVYEWIDRFRQTAIKEADKQAPNVGDHWVADETVLKIGGKKYWLIDILDSKTRFFIYSYISKNRSLKDIKYAFEKSYELTKKYPKTVTTDGWAGYPDGIEQAYGAYTKHQKGNPFQTDDTNTNLIERVQGTLKDRTKVLRGLKTKETADEYLKGWLVHYNYFRNHESLNDLTPANAAGAKLPFSNWLGVVKAEQQTLTPFNHPTLAESSQNAKPPKLKLSMKTQTPIKAKRRKSKTPKYSKQTLVQKTKSGFTLYSHKRIKGTRLIGKMGRK